MNHWIKDALLDLFVLAGLAVYAFLPNQILEIVLWIYTALLLLSKVLVLFVDFLKHKAGKSSVPPSFYHLVYLVSVILLAISGNYYLTGAWAVIWILSAVPALSKKK